ncbi:hypothetical protein SCHPADRAFT_997871 [Schizopora paradoxa]|uniref:Aminoglycoside phosphotransferase domain-containing protein n=1 Tax=Schizopora paradoxa TaxID=27342 RepID=A0A0H2S7C1_9AGAM|nr:hypothetical protein SCHPADRAFT_997871 [Schizopora paradoxa]
MSAGPSIDFEILKQTVFEVTGELPSGINFIARDDTRRTFEILLNPRHVIACEIYYPHAPSYLINSKIATMRFIRDFTPIPVPRILAFEVDASHPLGPFIMLERAEGRTLESILLDLSHNEQDALAAQLARWFAKLSRFKFDFIGSLYSGKEDNFIIGPMVKKQFFSEGRARLSNLDRGPYKTVKEYLLACTQREIDCSRTLSAQDASVAYQRDLEDCRVQVEQSMAVMESLIQKCPGLDDSEVDGSSPFSFDLHGISLKDVVVASDEPSRIVSVGGWDCICTMPLWQCGRLPRWLVGSLSEPDDGTKVRLAAIYRHVISAEEGKESLLVQALSDSDSTRCALLDLCEYDAFKDGFLLRPALESIAATLPGNEDMEGLSALLDPSTVIGRVARISLMTTGSAGDALSLAFSEMTMGEGKRKGN